MKSYIPALYFITVLSLNSYSSSLDSDGFSLLALKAAVTVDPYRSFSSWKASDESPCKWIGITCNSGSGRVSEVSISNKSLKGYIPSELGLLPALKVLSLRQNDFSNSIPSNLFTAASLVSLDLSHNSLSGRIPSEIQRLENLTHLDISSNLLTGSLPSALVQLTSLSGTLNLSYNQFSGPIPNSFGYFPVTLNLDLRNNNLSGPIPQTGSLLNQGPMAFTGNRYLCGFPLQTPCEDTQRVSPPQNLVTVSDPATSSPSNSPRPKEKGARVALSIPILSVVVFMIATLSLSVWLIRKRRDIAERIGDKERFGTGAGAEDDEGRTGQFHAVDESFTLELEELLRASAYMVGKSCAGIVYKVVIGGGVTLAVRRLSEGGEGCLSKFKEFEAEVQAIARLRHPNILRLRAYYYASNEKLLVSDYIPNGSLHSALHCSTLNSSPALSWDTRLSIAQGIVRGLTYIHEFGPRKYVHGNFKSSKVLLDEHFHPYISGFGLSRLGSDNSTLLDPICKRQNSTHVAGSRVGHCFLPSSSACYLAPEARASGARLTQKCDVYAFGVVLLELLTGRLPDAKLDYGGRELEGFVREAFTNERPLYEIVDHMLLIEVYAKKQVLAVFQIALGCTELDPERRLKMRAVCDCLCQIGHH